MYLRKLAALLFTVLMTASSASALEIVSPSDGALLREGKVVFIGVARKAETGKLEYGGRTTSFRIKDGSFSLVVSLPAGEHRLTFNAGRESAAIKIKVDPKADKGAYRYHAEVSAEKCKACHDEDKPFAKMDSAAEVCVRCHKTEEKRYTHGPFAIGLCAECHNPHGSSLDKYLRLAVVELCNDCHNQPVSEKHRKNAGDDLCTDCHAPHASDKQFLLR